MPGAKEVRLAAAADVAHKLQRWIKQLIALPIDELSPEQLEGELNRIARD